MVSRVGGGGGGFSDVRGLTSARGCQGFPVVPEESCTGVCAAPPTGSMHFLRLPPPLQERVQDAKMHAHSKKSAQAALEEPSGNHLGNCSKGSAGPCDDSEKSTLGAESHQYHLQQYIRLSCFGHLPQRQ